MRTYTVSFQRLLMCLSLCKGKLKHREKGYLVGFYRSYSFSTSITRLAEWYWGVFFFKQKHWFTGGISFMPTHWNKLCHGSIYWRTLRILTGDSEKGSLYIQIPSTSYKNWEERSLVYWVAWLHFTAPWHWGREDASFVCCTAAADNDRGVWSTGMSLL